MSMLLFYHVPDIVQQLAHMTTDCMPMTHWHSHYFTCFPVAIAPHTASAQPPALPHPCHITFLPHPCVSCGSSARAQNRAPAVSTPRETDRNDDGWLDREELAAMLDAVGMPKEWEQCTGMEGRCSVMVE